METKEFKFNEQIVEFELDDKHLMVNATQMAKTFGKDTHEFLSMKGTQSLILAYCQTGDFRFENEFSPEGKYVKVIRGGRNNGTWIDRRIAIAFAMWLNPFFAVWVCDTIDDILFSEYAEIDKQIKESAKRKARIKMIREDLELNPSTDERVVDLFKLESEDRKEYRKPFAKLGMKAKEEVKQCMLQFATAEQV